MVFHTYIVHESYNKGVVTMLEHIYKKEFKRGKASVIECQSCGYNHLYPIPTDEQLQSFYEKIYFEDLKEDWTKDQLEESVFWGINFEDKKDNLEALLSTGSRRILDVGCGNGLFLKFMQRHNWDVLGIEPSQIMANYVKKIGVPVINDIVENVHLEAIGTFDVVNLSFVLEHVSNPHQVCKWAYSLLNPGGILLIEVPNDFNEFQMAINEYFGKEMWWISYPDHINYFNFDSLSHLLNKAGFEIVHKDTSFPLEMFVLMGEDYVGNKEIGKAIHTKRVSFEKVLVDSGRNAVKKKLYQSFADMGLGRTTIMYACKP